MKRINTLIKEIRREPFEGIGKPEALKHAHSGYWSRRDLSLFSQRENRNRNRKKAE
ncbi:type II toxin-antitoxin system YoeB family toxin [Spongiibacter taiwanensis]|uniref:type II toxin-antitoxin system YoeB family toxin n=1 Tax=Spongiibacter taiwanensis TaxID=1748242 RepID=UPI003D806719